MENETWELVDLPERREAVDCKWFLNSSIAATVKLSSSKGDLLLPRAIVRNMALTMTRLFHPWFAINPFMLYWHMECKMGC